MAVHGLNGHREKTWTVNNVNWLCDLLPSEVPNARIMSWGYDANTHSTSQISAQQCLFCLFDLKLSSTKRFHQFLVKQSWKEHLQEHFWYLEDRYNRFMKAGESKIVSCPDPRCAFSFDSIQDFQCHCQDVHCVECIKLDPIKRRRLTRQSSLNVKAFLGANVKPKHRCDLLNGESPYKRVNETIIFEYIFHLNPPTLKTVTPIPKKIKIENKYNLSKPST